MNILLVGNGAREHAIAEAIVRDGATKLLTFGSARNPGIARLSADYFVGDINDLDGVAAYAKSKGASVAVIGPEAPIVNGVVDGLEDAGVPTVGPRQLVGRLETSKSFARALMGKYHIPGCPEHNIFKSTQGVAEDMAAYIKDLGEFVIKPDGLTGGKGVMVFGEHLHNLADGVKYATEVLKSHESVIIEEKLDGEEFSLQCLTDGETILPTPPVQDHKRAFDGDKGQNTGGMGSYSDADHLLPFLKKRHVDDALDITRRVAKSLRIETGVGYKGVMYGGFMVTASGVKLIEYNARFGDPEAMNVLPIMKTNFAEVCQAIAGGTLRSVSLEFQDKATVCKYLVPKEYPAKGGAGKVLKINEGRLAKIGARCYFAAVDERDGRILTSDSRALAVLGIADKMPEAEKIAEGAVRCVEGKLRHRRDIGTKALLEKRVKHMKRLEELEKLRVRK